MRARDAWKESVVPVQLWSQQVMEVLLIMQGNLGYLIQEIKTEMMPLCQSLMRYFVLQNKPK